MGVRIRDIEGKKKGLEAKRIILPEKFPPIPFFLAGQGVPVA
jgi:hypothetical protein